MQRALALLQLLAEERLDDAGGVRVALQRPSLAERQPLAVRRHVEHPGDAVFAKTGAVFWPDFWKVRPATPLEIAFNWALVILVLCTAWVGGRVV